MASKVRVGVIGIGFGSVVQIPALQAHAETEVVAVCSARAERAREAAERFHIPHAFTDYHDLINHPEVDLVSVATPVDQHYPMALAALEAGKHVLCEKPLAMNAAEASALVEAAEKAEVVHVVDHEFRFAPQRALAKELIQEGYLGDLRFAVIRLLFPLERSKWGWLVDASRGGGLLGAMGSHYIDSLRYWFGEVEAVSAFTAVNSPEKLDPETGQTRVSDADDTFAVQLRMCNGGWAAMAASLAIHVGSGVSIELYGSEGSLLLPQERNVNPRVDGKLLGCRKGDTEFRELELPERLRPYAKVSGDLRIPSFMVLVDRLVEAIRGGKPVIPTFVDGLRVQEVIDAVRQSSAQGTQVQLALSGRSA
ncbi:MAG: Gfo/Idh/MocA family protein [Dehalococcoidia bacterium]